jgi:hypothetical protein
MTVAAVHARARARMGFVVVAVVVREHVTADAVQILKVDRCGGPFNLVAIQTNFLTFCLEIPSTETTTSKKNPPTQPAAVVQRFGRQVSGVCSNSPLHELRAQPEQVIIWALSSMRSSPGAAMKWHLLGRLEAFPRSARFSLSRQAIEKGDASREIVLVNYVDV